MSVRVITPATFVVSRAEAKAHLRIDESVTDDDDYIDRLIAAAQGWLDGPAGWLGRSIGVQQLEARDVGLCARTRLRYGPVIEIAAVTFEGDDGERAEADPSTYHLDSDVVVVDDGAAAWAGRPERRITYWAGYGRRATDPDEWITEAPEPVKHAILMLVGQWWKVREAVNVGNIVNAMPFAVEALLQPYRVWR